MGMSDIWFLAGFMIVTILLIAAECYLSRRARETSFRRTLRQAGYSPEEIEEAVAEMNRAGWPDS